jgi:hypothetical protein
MIVLQTFLSVLFFLFQSWVASYFLIVIIGALIDVFEIKTAPRINLNNAPKKYSFAAIITLHQDTKFLLPILDAMRKQNYKRVEVFVIADDCPAISLPFSDSNIHIIHPPLALHSKIKSLKFALEHIDETKFDALAIFDPDNLIHPNFFNVINAYFNAGYKAVQSNILPKNFDTSFARLDALNDQYYNFIDRYLPSKIRLNAHIGGRGTVVDIKVYKSILYTNFLGGFDKKLQCELAKTTLIGFASEAKLFDEKVNTGSDLQHQRTRWINTYFRYFSESLKVFTLGLRKLSFRLMFFGYNNLRPPLFIQMVLAVFCVVTSFIFFRSIFWIWIIILSMYSISFFYIIQKAFTFTSSLRIISQTPLFFIRQVRALFNIQKANKQFLQTKNNNIIFIEDILSGGMHT